MAIMSSKQLSSSIKSIKNNAAKLREQIHEALVSATFYAYKDGNTTTLDQIVEAVGNGTHKRGITMWVELVAGIAHVKEGKFALNKKIRNESGVTDEATFASIEEEIRKVAWYEVAGEQKVESVFDADKYLDNVVKKLTRENQTELANMVKDLLISYHIKLNGSVADMAKAA